MKANPPLQHPRCWEVIVHEDGPSDRLLSKSQSIQHHCDLRSLGSHSGPLRTSRDHYQTKLPNKNWSSDTSADKQIHSKSNTVQNIAEFGAKNIRFSKTRGFCFLFRACSNVAACNGKQVWGRIKQGLSLYLFPVLSRVFSNLGGPRKQFPLKRISSTTPPHTHLVV